MPAEIHHHYTSRDNLFLDISRSLEIVSNLWPEGKVQLRYTIPVLCAIRMEAFVNTAGKVWISDWDHLERKKDFEQKCRLIGKTVGFSFRRNVEPEKTAFKIFEVRDQLVHPKMMESSGTDVIDQDEYERRANSYFGIEHPLRRELSEVMVEDMLRQTEAFISKWTELALEGQDFWLGGGSRGSYSIERKSGS